jgi:FKBP-type peptidyl-prolyl cis-trans isomerase FkpA
VIPGFEVGVFGMTLGGVRRMIIPPALGYGDSVREVIPRGSVLIFKVEVLDVERAFVPGN